MKHQLNWILVLVLSILFGFLGIDRFIMRQPLLGLLKLLTLGGLGLWWLIDVILIATKYPFQDIEWIDLSISSQNFDFFQINPKVEKTSQAANNENMKVNWLFLLVISILFGTLGIDRFIMGDVFLGLLKLLTAGGFGIWWLIDIILIAMRYDFKNIEWV